MTITIHEAYAENYNIKVLNYLTLTSKNPEFIKAYGKSYKVPKIYLFETLDFISSWVNNDLHEECLFEID